MHGLRRGKSTESVRECFLAPAPNDTMKKQSRERNPADFKRVTSMRFFFLCMISLKPCKELFFLNSCSNLVNRCERWSKVKKQVTPAKFDKSGKTCYTWGFSLLQVQWTNHSRSKGVNAIFHDSIFEKTWKPHESDMKMWQLRIQILPDIR